LSKRSAIRLLFLSTVLVATAYASAFLPGGTPGWAPWLLSLGTVGALVSAMAMGAARGGHVGRAAPALLLTFLILAGGFAAILLMPSEDPSSAVLWLGLPPRAAVLLYGIGLSPVLIVPIVYALTFDDSILGEATLRRVAAMARENGMADLESGAVVAGTSSGEGREDGSEARLGEARGAGR